MQIICCERRDVRKQTKSLMTSMITGRFHFAPGEEKEKRKIKSLTKARIVRCMDKRRRKILASVQGYETKALSNTFYGRFENLNL